MDFVNINIYIAEIKHYAAKNIMEKKNYQEKQNEKNYIYH